MNAGSALVRGCARAAAGVAVAAMTSLVFQGVAEAHLLPANHGTVNLVDNSAFAVLSVPTTALANVDDNHDGWVDMLEFQRHETQIRDEIDSRFAISDGETAGITVRIDLVLSPQHDAMSDRADQIVALKHTQFASPPGQIRVRTDLFGPRANEREVSILATRGKDATKQSETALLSPGSSEHVFFGPPPGNAGSPSSRSLGAWSFLGVMGFLGGASVAGARLRNRQHLPRTA